MTAGTRLPAAESRAGLSPRMVLGAAAVTVVLMSAAATSMLLVSATGVAPGRVARWVWTYGGPVHTAVALWLLLAPAALAVGALARRRTPWVWAGATGLYLVALVVGAARYAHHMDREGWAIIGAVALAGAVSVISAFPAPGDRRGS